MSASKLISQTQPPLSYTEIQHTIRVALSVLSTHGLDACLFGSAAMLAHGMEHRLPEDIDILILNASSVQTDETIKDLLVSSTTTSSGFFFLTASRKQGATHRILWYTLPPTVREHNSKKSKHDRASGFPKTSVPSSSAPISGQQDLKNQGTDILKTPDQSGVRACKIDILLPGPNSPLDIPHIPKDKLFLDSSATFLSYASASASASSSLSNPLPYSNSKPVSAPAATPIAHVPLASLLSLKLRAWVDHSQPSAQESEADKIRARRRVAKDEADIEELIRLVGSSRTSREKGRMGHGDGHGIGVRGGDANEGTGNEELWTWTHAGFRTRKDARRAAGAYARKWPGTKSAWAVVGFGA
uniref:Uncharacterized protein n=1 Tax=Psilocybe cubensis TaxID=181762 RepID=A0A8H8CEQ1_PSICU